MKVSLNWLREWLDVGSDVPALAHSLTMAGLEIEAIERAGPPLSGIVVGEILSVEKHPDAAKLNVCRVATGSGQLQIVCGAPNVRVGMKAPLATIGAKLPNGMEIKQAQLRGVESAGMLCSAQELALSEDSSGLLDLPVELRTGQDLASALSLDDTIFEVNLTPNRGDCMSIAGVAREAAAARSVPLQVPTIAPVAAALQDVFPVRLEAGPACPKFAGRVVRGIRVGAKSPFWMQERLRRTGVRPISAIVDVTNYVMLELGQPMHAYDLGKLHGAIVVRPAQAGEQLTLLDGRTIELSPDVTVIADERAALGIAGVMGGEDSGIADATTDVFLEVAFFNPEAIAGRGRRYGLITDASQRFERGVDPELQERAIERATQLLLDCAGGQAGPVCITRTAVDYPPVAPIRLRHQRIQQVLGVKIEHATIRALLLRLGMTLATSGNDWQVTPPSWRFDLCIEEDLIEEVARLYGFDNIPEQNPIAAWEMQPWSESRIRNERAADLLVDRGYHEAITYTFTDAAWQSILFPEQAIALSNPISAELAVMRLSLWPGLIQAVRENQRRQQLRVRLFEIGRRFGSGKDQAKDQAKDPAKDRGRDEEAEMIAGIAAGPLLGEQWGSDAGKVDFFDVKADVEALLALSGAHREFRFSAQQHPALHPGQSARIWRGDRPVGWLGALHPQHLKRMDLTYPTFVFELDAAATLGAQIPEFVGISKYPAIRRDVAVIVDEAIPVDAIKAVVHASAGVLLNELTVLSVYRGRQFEKGKKSIALGMQLQDTSRTLTDHDADGIVAQVVDHLARQLNATIRDK